MLFLGVANTIVVFSFALGEIVSLSMATFTNTLVIIGFTFDAIGRHVATATIVFEFAGAIFRGILITNTVV